ncbi:hypothetical protein TCAL_01536 [Tigriopus californicus]|uniref:FHF complex subunit HOOK-interacting protein C-terminal domain-containing protein n=1 Tax=Tigriopus californicus TaxID=6832 RepID=A0A553P6R5_TIGCA|nr:FHF complex subunit HOOK-interacting protein 1A-like isoform X2 [Tigriopus californicus]TRY73372.1 hypothetical protein TCAL_01536 [Tigriopus californicus]|eukprot:TCALIF_01536-PA protein Name:"Similar to FAM160A1 Protein FAM160A1 (Homo sapiens)" AED:0.04 eAED:0.04 QI:331/1/1/1/1/1/9/226/1118
MNQVGWNVSGGRESPAWVRAETFQRHWQQLRDIATIQMTVPSADEMVAVLNLLDQMTRLLDLEMARPLVAPASTARRSDDLAPWPPTGTSSGDPSPAPSSPSSPDTTPLTSLSPLCRDLRLPCLDLLLSENVLAHILATSRMPIDDCHSDELRRQQLVLYETLLNSDQAPTLLTHQPFLKPLLELLHQFDQEQIAASSSSAYSSSPSTLSPMTISRDTEVHLVLLLNQLCQRLMENMHLLDLFFHASHPEPESPDSAGQPTRFLIFSILIHYIHREGHTGQLARDALIHCMSLSHKNEAVGRHIAKQSNFCPVLATGLSGLYSLLPRRLPRHLENDPHWHRIVMSDLNAMPELASFLSSLEFCDAVLQIAHPKVREHLLGLIYMGFLVPVLGPALTQISEAEVICTTAYVDLFLRRLSEPSLLAVFLRFIFTDQCDDKSIIDTLVIRISSQTKLCQVSLSLFETLINLNCEDVLLWLVFRHLIPLRHILPSQKDLIREPDLHGRAAQKILSLTPICCQEATSYYLEHKMNHTANQSQQHNALANFWSGLRNNLVYSSNESDHNRHPHPPEAVLVADEASEVLNNSHGDSRLRGPPSSKIDERNPLQRQSENFKQYLHDARALVRHRYEASLAWQYDYDGLRPPPDALKASTSDSSAPKIRARQDMSSPNDLSICDTNSDGPFNSTSLTETAPSSGYLSLSHPIHSAPNAMSSSIMSCSPMTSSGPVSLIEEEDREFWSLMNDPGVSEGQIKRVIKKMQLQQHQPIQHPTHNAVAASHPLLDEQLSVSSGQSGGDPTNGSGGHVGPMDANRDQILGPKASSGGLLQEKEQLDYAVTSLGMFLDLLLEKVELMASNSLSTNLLVTSILSSLAAYPQPLLRAVLTLPDVVFQPSVRGLFQAIASLRQKLDNIMPTLPGAEEAIILARRFLTERITANENGHHVGADKKKKRRDSVASTISQIGQEARAHKSSFTAAFSSMFRSRKNTPNSSPGPASFNSSMSSPPHSLLSHTLHQGGSNASHSSDAHSSSSLTESLNNGYNHGHSLSKEVRSQALAAVILEEWLLELAAIAQEQSNRQKEQIFEFGLGFDPHRNPFHHLSCSSSSRKTSDGSMRHHPEQQS